MMKHLLAGLSLGVALCAPLSARASTPYPEKLASRMPCTPQCTLCHTDNLGGIGKLSLFGQTIKTTGVLPPLVGDPVASLDRLGAADTDGDGTSDIAEVTSGTDPSVAGLVGICGGPQYGCGASIAPQPRSKGLATGLGLFTALAFGTAALRLRTKRASKPAA